jgi:hypothetical protein
MGGPRGGPARRRRRSGRYRVNVRPLLALAVADFRERVRRPAFGMTLLATMVFAYLAAPPARAGYALMQVGDFRGIYDSWYVGTLLAVMTGGWLAIAGFYVVKNTVSRDEATGVGQILAATPLPSRTYLVGKFLSNFLVLAAMTGVIAVMALVMLWVRDEASGVDLVALWLPFLLFPISLITLVAGAAVLFETVPRLRGGFGNVVWAFAASLLTIVSQAMMRFAPGAHFDPLGLAAVSDAMRDDVLAQHPGAEETYLIIGLVTRSEQPERFEWASGLDLTTGLLLPRGILIVLGVAFALLPALWFARFDRTQNSPVAPDGGEVPPAVAEPAADTVPAVPPSRSVPAGSLPTRAAVHIATIGELTPPRRGRPFGRLVVGELRILLSRTSRWWLLGAVALVVAGAMAPTSVAVSPLLAVAWLWPVLIWSRVGTQQYEHEVHPLVTSAPASRRRLLAEWVAALLVTAVVGAGPLVRQAIAGDGAGVAAWLAGAVFIPTLALALGTLSRSPRMFQAAYLLLWLVVFTGERTLDFMGTVRADGDPAGPAPVVVLAVTAALGAIAFAVHQIRQARR